MIEISPNLFVGNQSDFENNVRFQVSEWFVIHACKEPYHRSALGYSGRAAPKDHPEYLIARRDNRLILNLIDPADPAYIPKEIIDAALEYIDTGLREGKKVLVHCNQGESRGPSIGLLYLVSRNKISPVASLHEVEKEFREIYPMYNPSGGMRGFLQNNWKVYTKGE